MRTTKSIFNMITVCILALMAVDCRMDELEGIVEAAEKVISVDPELMWDSDQCEVTIGADAEYPALINKYGVPVTYSSSDTEVALISDEGEITLTGGGRTTITASSAESSGYEASSASYTLVVIKSAAGISWSASACSAEIGEDNEFPELSNPNELQIIYSSSNESVARISSEGVVTLVAEGAAVITASSEATATFQADEDSYSLTVTDGESVKKDAGLAWSASAYTVTYGEAATYPTLSNPNALDVTFSSNDESVAVISTDGQVTVLAAGTTTIIASSEADEEYNACSVFYKLTVDKAGVVLSWSSSTCRAIMDEENEFPALSVSQDGLEIVYSSSDPSVAEVDEEGKISLISRGTTDITASFAGDERFEPASATYVLTVASGGDEGAGVYNYPSTGDPSSNDDIVNTAFTRKITIIYSTSSDAKVIGDYHGYVTVDGNDVTVNDTGSEYIVYELQGTAADGFLKLYSSNRQALLLNGVNITNRSGAAVNIQSRKRTFVMVEGSNVLTDGAAYSETPSSEDEKAAFFSEGQLIFSGSGSLTVNASGKSGIISDDYIRVMNSPVISSTSSSGHAVRGQKEIRIDAGTITAKTSADMKKGFSSDSLVVFNGGKTTIAVTGNTAYDSESFDYTSTAGIKADKLFYMNGGSLTITNSGSGGKGINVGSSDTSNDCKAYFKGGTVDITCSGAYDTAAESGAKGIKVGKKFSSSSYTGDMYVSGGIVRVRSIGSNSSRDSGNEAIESKGVIEVTGGELFGYSTSDDAINSASTFTVSGGYVCGLSTGNDGLDSNGNCYIKGGVVMAASAKSPEVGIDTNSEGGYKLYIQGGVLFVTGGLESGASMSQACYKASSFTKGVWYGLTVGSKTYAFKTHSTAAGTTLVVSGAETPTLTSGITVSGGTEYFDGYANVDGTYSGGNSVSLSTYSSSSGGGPGGRP